MAAQSRTISPLLSTILVGVSTILLACPADFLPTKFDDDSACVAGTRGCPCVGGLCQAGLECRLETCIVVEIDSAEDDNPWGDEGAGEIDEGDNGLEAGGDEGLDDGGGDNGDGNGDDGTEGVGGDEGGDDSGVGEEGSDDTANSDGTDCHPFHQDCPNSNHKCTGTVSDPDTCCIDANHCVPKLGSKKLGESCERDKSAANDDCDEALFCYPGTSGGNGAGICKAYCDADDEDSCQSHGLAPEWRCFDFNAGALPLCERTCDPVTQDCEGTGKACYAVFDNFLCTTTAVPWADVGEECDLIQSCAKGLACLGFDLLPDCPGDNCCTQYCDLEASTDPCARLGQTCVPFSNDPASGKEHVGVCLDARAALARDTGRRGDGSSRESMSRARVRLGERTSPAWKFVR